MSLSEWAGQDVKVGGALCGGGVVSLIPILSWLLRFTLWYGSQSEGQLNVHSVPLGLLLFIVGLVFILILILGITVMWGGVEGG